MDEEQRLCEEWPGDTTYCVHDFATMRGAVTVEDPLGNCKGIALFKNIALPAHQH